MRRAHRPRSGEGRAARIRVDEPRVLALQDHLEGGLAAPFSESARRLGGALQVGRAERLHELRLAERRGERRAGEAEALVQHAGD